MNNGKPLFFPPAGIKLCGYILFGSGYFFTGAVQALGLCKPAEEIMPRKCGNRQLCSAQYLPGNNAHGFKKLIAAVKLNSRGALNFYIVKFNAYLAVAACAVKLII